ncbi:hypothetical protein [Mycetocola sp.]|uniref:hypothetical protein n=1 Tax=Mycetocola sp. TaxID=1871042 RepID=UPI002608B3ED|nr:hypothetical protein [Mycetocola sp.]MCU1559440.1 pentapeptide repeat-containing protein [Mycetocola sp.]
MKSRTHPPRIDALRTVQRSEDDAASVGADSDLELESFTDIERSGRGLTGLTVRERAFDGVELDVTRATLRHVDVRGPEFGAVHGLEGIAGVEGIAGATVNEAQVADLAQLFALQPCIIAER